MRSPDYLTGGRIIRLKGGAASDSTATGDLTTEGFLSPRHETTAGNRPQFPHLRLTMPVREYPLAMKCMASRIGGTTGEPSDVSDITFLIRHLGLGCARDALDIVAQYYPSNQIPVKTQYLIEGLFDEGHI
jgi:hypothetical protein